LILLLYQKVKEKPKEEFADMKKCNILSDNDDEKNQEARNQHP